MTPSLALPQKWNMPSEVRKVQLSEQRRSSARQTHWHVWRLKVRQTEIARAILSANRKPTKLSAMYSRTLHLWILRDFFIFKAILLFFMEIVKSSVQEVRFGVRT